MTSQRPQCLPILAALVGLILLPGAATPQETQCPQRRPEEGKYSRKVQEYIERAQDQESEQDRLGYYRFALGLLEQGIAEDPDNSMYYLTAGQVSLELGDYVGADTMFEHATCYWQPYTAMVDGFRIVAWTDAFNRGQELQSNGKAEAAVAAYRQAYAIYDLEPYPVFQIASYHAQRAQVAESDSAALAELDGAIWGFQESLAASRRSETLSEEDRLEFLWTSTANLAQLVAYAGRMSEAADAYEQFLTDYPDHTEAMLGLSTLLALQVGAIQDSLSRVEDPAEQEKLLARRDALGERVWKQYTKLLAVEDAGLEAADYHDMGIGLYQLEKPVEAATALRSALQLEPYRPQSLQLLAHCFYLAENWDSLAGVAQQLAERYPNNLDNLSLLAHGYRGVGEPEKALAALQRREALPFQLSQLDLAGGTAAGQLENLKLEPGSLIEVEFTFYDDAGEAVAVGRLSQSAPAQGEAVPFRVAPEAPIEGICGFAYRVVEPG